MFNFFILIAFGILIFCPVAFSAPEYLEYTKANDQKYKNLTKHKPTRRKSTKSSNAPIITSKTNNANTPILKPKKRVAKSKKQESHHRDVPHIISESSGATHDGVQRQPDSDTQLIKQSEELWITTLILEDYNLSQDFFVYTRGDKIFVPFDAFNSTMLIHSKKQSNTLYDGYIMGPKDGFTLDLERLTFKANGKTVQFKSDDIAMFDGALYLSGAVLEEVMFVKFTLHAREQRLFLKTNKPLPIQDKIKREKLLENAKFRFNKDSALFRNALELDEVVPVKYRSFSVPSIDILNTISYQKTPASPSVASQNSIQNNARILSLSHLGFMQVTTSGTINHTNATNASSNTNIRITAERNSIEPPTKNGHFLPKQFKIGDVNSTPVNTVSIGNFGRGFSISNLSPIWQVTFNKLLVSGNANPGWDVELYVNGSLYNFSRIEDTGIYKFEDVPLNAGGNMIKLVFYGPFGEKKEVIKEVNLGSGAVKKGKLFYDATVMQDNKFMLGFLNTSLGATNNSIVSGAERYDVKLKYGLLKNTMLESGFLSYDRNSALAKNGLTGFDRVNFVTTSLTSTIGRAMLNASYARDTTSGENSMMGSVNLAIGSANILGQYTKYSYGFITETRNIISNFIDSEYHASLRHPIRIFGMSFTNFIDASRAKFNVDNQMRDKINHTISTNILGVNVSNSINYTSLYSAGNDTSKGANSQGSFTFSHRIFYGIIVRGNVNYILQPTKQMNYGMIRLDYNRGNEFGFYVGATKNYTSSDVSTYVAGLNILHPKAMYSIGSTYSTNGALGLVFTVSTSMARVNNSLINSSKSFANSGIVHGHVFVDNNNNGVMDGDDYPLPNVGINVNKRKDETVKSDQNGNITMLNVPAKTPLILEPDEANSVVSDEMLGVASKSKIKTVLLPGIVEEFNFPLSRLTDIEGVLSMKDKKGKIRTLSGVTMNLLDSYGKVVATTKSAYDGYYIFARVVSGKYKIVMDENDLRFYRDNFK